MSHLTNNPLSSIVCCFVFFFGWQACRPYQPSPQPPVPEWRTTTLQASVPVEQPIGPVPLEPIVLPRSPSPVLTVSAPVHPWSSMGLEPDAHVVELVGRPIANPLQARVAFLEVGHLESVWATAIRDGERVEVSWTQTPDLSEGIDCANLGGWMTSCGVASWVVAELVAELSSPNDLLVQLAATSTSWGALALSFENLPTDSGFALLGFSEGDLITVVNQAPVVSVDQLVEAIQIASGHVLFEFERMDWPHLLSIQLAEQRSLSPLIRRTRP